MHFSSTRTRTIEVLQKSRHYSLDAPPDVSSLTLDVFFEYIVLHFVEFYLLGELLVLRLKDLWIIGLTFYLEELINGRVFTQYCKVNVFLMPETRSNVTFRR